LKLLVVRRWLVAHLRHAVAVVFLVRLTLFVVVQTLFFNFNILLLLEVVLEQQITLAAAVLAVTVHR
jgi:hypothetical protein